MKMEDIIQEVINEECSELKIYNFLQIKNYIIIYYMGGIFSLFSSKTNNTKQNYQGRSYISDDGDGYFGGKKKSHKRTGKRSFRGKNNKTRRH
jgi:hypothetical protein